MRFPHTGGNVVRTNEAVEDNRQQKLCPLSPNRAGFGLVISPESRKTDSHVLPQDPPNGN